MTLYEIIKSLEDTPGRNDKIEILKANQSNNSLKNFLRLCLDPYINFWIRKIPEKVKGSIIGIENIDDAMEWLETVISTRMITGNEAINQLGMVLNQLKTDEQNIVQRILKKSPDCGVLGKSVNVVWPDLIKSYPCLLASPYEEKLAKKIDFTKGAYVQLKSDGLRVNIIVDASGGVVCYTRAGNILEVNGAFDFVANIAKNSVFDGELLTINQSTGKFNIRQVSNGICNKAVKGTLSSEEAKTMHAVIWDWIPLDDFKKEYSAKLYEARFNVVSRFIADHPEYSHKISLIPGKKVKSIQEALDFFKEKRDEGEEGAMLKSALMPWENKRSKMQLKMKLEAVNEFKIVGFKEGNGKLAGNLGSLECESEDGKVKVSVSGFDLKTRSEIYAALTGNFVQYEMKGDLGFETRTADPKTLSVSIESIVSVKHGGLTESNGEYSVFLPRIEEIRFDKTVADTFETISKNTIGI